VHGSESLKGRLVAIQGVGAVGGSLARLLVEAGAKVLAADLNQPRLEALAKEVGLRPVSDEDVLRVKGDVFAPCALGAVLNDRTIPLLACKIVAGAANNQLLEPRHGDALRARGILWAPDYVINAGGIINVACELLPGGYDEKKSLEKIDRIPLSLREIFDLAESRGITTRQAADERAEQILSEAQKR
jgi:leucine dehydrogenase